MMRAVVPVVVALCAVVAAKQHGCIKDGVVGVCVTRGTCRTAINKNEICGFNNEKYEPEFCCFENIASTAVPTTTSREEETEDEEDDDSEEFYNNTCEPLDPKLTAQRNGRKAWDKCLEYQEQLVYRCKRSETLSFGGGWSRATCKMDLEAVAMIVGGTPVAKDTYTHMALLGLELYSGSDINWVCGGTLISDRFILTAAHCVENRMFGTVKYAYIGSMSRTELRNNLDRKYEVKAVYRHPNYHPSQKYNDIALLELEKPVILNEHTVPACLPIGNLRDVNVTATGWGLTEFKGSTSDALQKVGLTKFTLDECREQFPPSNEMTYGYDETIQLCYGDRYEDKDTCQGDSGGPVQIGHDRIHCMHVVVGVTSTGRDCGFAGQPSLYTRVSHYVPWIESIVWP